MAERREKRREGEKMERERGARGKRRRHDDAVAM